MSEAFTVTTPFADVSELAQGFVNRVNEEQVLIPASSVVAEGEWAHFTVLLVDGTPAFAGLGRCIQVSDRGEDTPPDHPRYELLLDSLQYEEASQAVFDHLVAVRAALLDDGLLDEGQIDEGQIEDAPLGEEAAEFDAADEAVESFPHDGVTGELAASDVEALEAGVASGGSEDAVSEDRSELVSPFVVDRPAGGPLTRPIVPNPWRPQTPSRSASRVASSGFAYGRGQLPRPSAPPRPALDPSLKITPAPHPRHLALVASEGGFEPGYDAVGDGASGYGNGDYETAPSDSGDETPSTVNGRQSGYQRSSGFDQELLEAEELMSIPPEGEPAESRAGVGAAASNGRDDY